MPVYFIVSLCSWKLRNISSTSLSSMRDSKSVIRSNEFTVGSPKEGAQTTSFNLFAPAWNTVRQSWTSPSIIPLGTAKYLMRELIRPWYGATYFRSRNFFTFFRSTCFSSGFNGGCCRRDEGPLLVNIIRTPRRACVRYLRGKRKKSSLEPMGHWNHSFSAARHRISRIPSASSAAFLFIVGFLILSSQFGP